CADGTLYTGSTTDLDERIAMHNEGRGGAYTRSRRPVVLVHAELHEAMESAARRERQIKKWTGAKKEALVANDPASLRRLSISRASPRFKKTSTVRRPN